MVPVHAGWGIGENTVGINRRGSGQPIDPRIGYRQENADYLEIHPAEEHLMDISEQMKARYAAQSQKALKDMADDIIQMAAPVTSRQLPNMTRADLKFSGPTSFTASITEESCH